MSETPASPEHSPSAAPRRHHPLWSSALSMGLATRRLVRMGLSLMGAVLLLAAVAWAVLLFQILPRIGDWRQDVAEPCLRAIIR